MGLLTTLSIQKLNDHQKNEQSDTDSTVSHKQSINLYSKNQFHSNYKIDEHILKNYQKMFSLLILPKNKTYHFLQQISNQRPIYFQ